MSSSAAGGTGSGDRPGGERRQSFTKFMTRAKSALKRDKVKRRSSSGDVSGGETPSNSTTPLEGPPLASPSQLPERNPVETIPEQKEGKTETGEPKGKEPMTKEDVGKAIDKQVTTRAELQQQKARALFEKYGLTLEPHEWAISPTADRVERVQKPIRMRVHRQCHRCQTTYGADKVCVQCGHKRCKACPRYPVKKPKHAQEPSKVAGVTAATATAAAATQEGERTKAGRKYQLTIPAKVETQDRVRKDVRQRVHRSCHRCQQQFNRNEKTCVGCGHARCTKCPRDPAKLHKWPQGYPGDAEVDLDELIPAVKPREFKKVRMLVKWHCHNCDCVFSHGSKVCGSCEHERCQDCRRVPPKKIRQPAPEPDPELVQRVEARLANLRLSAKDEGGEAGATRLVQEQESLAGTSTGPGQVDQSRSAPAKDIAAQ